jgi:hypothetical protein
MTTPRRQIKWQCPNSNNQTPTNSGSDDDESDLATEDQILQQEDEPQEDSDADNAVQHFFNNKT